MSHPSALQVHFLYALYFSCLYMCLVQGQDGSCRGIVDGNLVGQYVRHVVVVVVVVVVAIINSTINDTGCYDKVRMHKFVIGRQ